MSTPPQNPAQCARVSRVCVPTLPVVTMMKTRTPDRDRSLPVQEEPEDDNHHGWVPNSRSGSGGGSGRDSRTGHRGDDDDDDTLIEQESEDQNLPGPNMRMRSNINSAGVDDDDDSGCYTPRSPTAGLPEGGQGHEQLQNDSLWWTEPESEPESESDWWGWGCSEAVGDA